jgi:hypothetical protein
MPHRAILSNKANTPLGQQQIMAPDITSNPSDFPSDQAAILRDLARNGAADEASIYGYPEMGSNMQSNGANPSQEYSFSDAYPIAGLSNSYHDMDDPTALLESLAAFEHPPTNDARTSVSNDHFASLLQAAATAEGAEIAQTEGAPEQHNAGQTGPSDDYGFFKRSFAPEPRPKRTCKARDLDGNEVDAGENDGRSYGLISNKRRNKTPPPEDPDQLAREREIWGTEDEDEADNDVSIPEDSFQQTPLSTAEARALGVHSAAALFRRASKASTKYARRFILSLCRVELMVSTGPPMSKLYLSLELPPEQFLAMQKAAKIYMLDENHPERRECVGTRGKGDTDVTKVLLFNTVKEFLLEGWGEKCFGENSPSGSTRKYKWPKDHSKYVVSSAT